jgi:hypothetical protein
VFLIEPGLRNRLAWRSIYSEATAANVTSVRAPRLAFGLDQVLAVGHHASQVVDLPHCLGQGHDVGAAKPAFSDVSVTRPVAGFV